MDCMRDQFYDGALLDGRFRTISPLNHGSFGMVFMAQDELTNDLVAVKCLTKRSASDDSVSSFAVDDNSEELACHTRFGSHPNIVNLVHSFETESHFYLVLEFCSRGDLYEAIRTGCGPLETEHVREFMLQLVDAIAYIHSKGMYHRDIKPENIFLTSTGALKLGDFGLATKDVWSYETTVGSDRYMSPEQYDSAGAGYSPAQADIWAIGICLLNILFSRNPFTTPSESDPLFLDFSRDNQSLFDVFPTMSQDTFEVITHCMSLDPRKRSLSNVREALLRVVTFTTFDESLDDFSLARPAAPTANREPLRTPSIQSPHIDQGSFPWAKALHASPPQAFRQLSAIPDTEIYDEDLFPSSEESNADWFSVSGKTPSIGSILNSSLGASMKSMAIRRPTRKTAIARADLTPISGSLPISMTKSKPIPSMTSVFGRKKDMVSKSWSEMWDEDIEEEEEHEKELKDRQALNARTWSHESQTKKGADLSARREGLSEPESSSFLNMRSSSDTADATNDIDADIVNDGFFFQDTRPRQPSPPRYSPPSKRSTFDKWAALGDRRRAATVSASKPPEQTRGRRNTNHGNNKNVNWGNGTSANVNGGLGLNFNAFGAGLWESGKASKANASTFSTHTNVNTQHLFQNMGKTKDKEKDCPWARDRDIQARRVTDKSAASQDVGRGDDLEWVGGWHSLDFQL